jgi:hypothetical protein
VSTARFTSHFATVAAMLLLAAVAVAVVAPVTAVAGVRSPSLAASITHSGSFSGVAATSASNAWAVGTGINGKTLILHWNGAAWKTVPSPSPGANGDYDALYGVAATSAKNAWAVGAVESISGGKALILHWNGAAWKTIPSPGAYAGLNGVAATSASNAWAVGNTSGGRTLILHWNGTAWTHQSSPNIEGAFQAVAATSARNAWAVGFQATSTGTAEAGPPLILHWNGVTWERVSTHLPAGIGNLRGVVATSASNAWAVGCSGCLAEGAGDPLIERWNGTTWKKVPAPSVNALAGLYGVTAISPANAWAVGTPTGDSGHTTGIAHWNGSTWTLVSSPNPGGQEHVLGVAATSAGNAWAVGETEATSPFEGVISHWNGSGWK